MSKSYTLEFNGSGVVAEGFFDSEIRALLWAESVLENLGYDPNELVAGDWDADGENDDGEQCYRMLFWAHESDAENDPGANAICQLCKVGDN